MKRILPLLVLTFLAWGCSKKHKAFTPTEVSYPSAPRSLKATVGDREVTLNWFHDEEVKGFYIYRADSVKAKFFKWDSTSSLNYIDSGLLNNREYLYKVSAYNLQGYEGPYSSVVSATPSAYDLLIDGGREFTNHQEVVVTLTAPEGISLTMLANDSLFASGSWEPFSPTKEWTLTNGDGEKWVFAKFKDSRGTEPKTPASDKITLDTHASIKMVSESSAGRILTPGDTIHFELDAGEPGGEATVDIGTVQTGIILQDNANGIYDSHFIIPGGIDVLQAKVVGQFTDRAGNQAPPVNAQGAVTIQSPPLPVELRPPTPVGNSTTSLNLSWSPSGAEDFAYYMLFQAQNPGVDSTSTLVTTINEITTTSFEDTGLKENSDYWYRIYVFDQSGLSAASNEVRGTTKQNDPPKPVVLYPPSPVVGSFSALNLSWSQNSDDDFVSYYLYRSTNAGVDSTCILVTTITSQTTTAYQDTGLDENTSYYYRVYVWDRGGLASCSNEEVGRTNQDEPPEPVDLYPPNPVSSTQIDLSWSQSEEKDFNSYRLFRSPSPGVDSTSYLVTTIRESFQTTHQDTGLEGDKTYYYRVFVCDNGGNWRRSNEDSATTENSPPQPIVLDGVAVLDSSSLGLSWSNNQEEDFQSYKVYRSNHSGVNLSSELIGEITNPYQTGWVDSGLDDNREYYYRVYVFDKGGLWIGSNEESGTTENGCPKAVVLFDPRDPTEVSLILSWTENQDYDFSSYRIYRSPYPGVSSGSHLVVELLERTSTTYQDTGLSPNTSYYYRVYVIDTGDKASGSNETSGKTLENLPPQPVILAQPSVEDSTTLRLNWSQNQDDDFASYRIFRSAFSPVDTTSTPISIVNTRETTEYLDSRLNMGQQYFYRLFVFDQGGLSAGSNEVSGAPSKGEK